MEHAYLALKQSRPCACLRLLGEHLQQFMLVSRDQLRVQLPEPTPWTQENLTRWEYLPLSTALLRQSMMQAVTAVPAIAVSIIQAALPRIWTVAERPVTTSLLLLQASH